jgi:putative transposase
MPGMARLKRFVVAGQVHHVVLRAAAGTAVFAHAEDAALLLAAVGQAASGCGVAVHGYSLCPPELQLLATPDEAPGLGRLVQALARTYGAPFNRRQGRAGSLWQGRFRAAPVDATSVFVLCLRYVEQLPVRLGLCAVAADHPWSSAAHHVGTRRDPMLAAVPAAADYWALGNTPFERDAAYAALLGRALSVGEISAIEAATLRGWALGPAAFAQHAGTLVARRPAPGARGRPSTRPGADKPR